MTKWQNLAPLALLLLLCGPAAAVSHRDNARHFTFTLPNGWSAMAPQLLAAINQEAKRLGVNYESAFQPGNRPPGTCPYVLVQVKPMSTAGAEEIEAALTRELLGAEVEKVEGELPDMVKDIKVGRPAFDRTRNRIVLRLESMVQGRKVLSISYGMIGKNAVVFLHCYAYAEDYERCEPVFETTADTFRYDEAFRFVPGGVAGPWWQQPMVVNGSVGGIALIGIFIGAWLRNRSAASLTEPA
jgi:hypothetical protein